MGTPIRRHRFIETIWRGRRTAGPLALAALLALGARSAAGDGMRAASPIVATVLWLLCIAVLVWLGVRSVPPVRVAPAEAAGVILLAGLAFLVRSYHLTTGPPMVSGDEASFALTALEFIDGPRSNPFITAWGSFPSLYPLVLSIPLRLFGATLATVRATSVLAGSVTVVATYIYARIAFGQRVALYSGVALALLVFHVHFSRLGLNNVWDGLFAALLAWTLSRAWRSGRSEAFAVPGVVLGLAQFFYVGSRVFFLLVPLWAGIVTLQRRPERLTLKGLAFLMASAILVSLPLALFYLGHPADFMAPLHRVSIFGRWWTLQTVTFGDPSWWVAGEQLLQAFLGFVVTPLRHFFVGQPLLNAFPAAIFLVGLPVLARRWREPDVLWLVIWLLGIASTVALSADAPAGQRYLGASAAVAVTVGLGLEAVIEFPRLPPRVVFTARVLGVALLAGVSVWYLARYLTTYRTLETREDFNRASVASAVEALSRSPSLSGAYLFVSPRLPLASNSALRFLLPELAAQDIPDGPRWRVAPAASSTYAFVFLPERRALLATIARCYPDGSLSVDKTPEGYVLSIVYIAKVHTTDACLGP